MIDRRDVERFTEERREIDGYIEVLIADMVEEIDVDALLEDPVGVMEAYFLDRGWELTEIFAPEALAIGRGFARKADV